MSEVKNGWAKTLVGSILIPTVIGIGTIFVMKYQIERNDKRLENLEKYNPELMNYKLDQITLIIEKISNKLDK